jgi:hypothetical protein
MHEFTKGNSRPSQGLANIFSWFGRPSIRSKTFDDSSPQRTSSSPDV